MFLNDDDIRLRLSNGGLVIDPRFAEAEDIGPYYVDLRLGTEFSMLRDSPASLVSFDPADPESQPVFDRLYETASVRLGQSLVLKGHRYILATTLQFIRIPHDLCGLVFLRSAWARIGLTVGVSRVDPGYQGRIVIQINNIGDIPIVLYPGVRIIHLCLALVSSPAHGTHQAKYSPQTRSGSFGSRLWLDSDFEKIRKLVERRSEELEPSTCDQPELRELLRAASEAPRSGKGEALEQFALRLFQNIKGLRVIKKNAHLQAEELDLLISNDISVGFWRFAGSPIVVECKNWVQRVGAREIGVLCDKLDSIGPDAKTGIILAPSGVSGTPERDALLKIREKRQRGQYIIVLDRDALAEVAASGRASEMIERKYDELLLI
jgi:dCTP deaminase